MADPNPSQKTLFAEKALDALTAVDQMLEPSPHSHSKVSPSEMHAYAVDASYQPTSTLLSALKVDRRLKEDFQRLLNNTSRYHLPQVAAASSGEIEQREIAGCKFSFRPSRADGNQMYVIIEGAAHLDFSPEILFVCAGAGEVSRLELPPAQNGRIQLLLDRKSDIAAGLLDITAEVYLK